MYELIKVSESCYYMNCPTKAGVIKVGDGAAVAIDSGSDKDAGKKLLRGIRELGFELLEIYNTHSHADHIGGNKYLQEQTGCAIFAKGIEADFTNHPILEPSLLYGAYPMQELHHKFLLAQESNAERLCGQNEKYGIEVIPLQGHSFDMVGFRCADGVVFLADALSSKETIEKYGIGYLWDVKSYIETLEKIKTMQAKLFVPSHAAPTENIAPLAQYNIDSVLAIGEKIASLCATPKTFEALLSEIFELYGLSMTLQQYCLVGSTVRSYLSWLSNDKRIACFFDGGKMLWESK